MKIRMRNLVMALAATAIIAVPCVAQNRGSMTQGRGGFGQSYAGPSGFSAGGQTGRSAFSNSAGRGQSRGGRGGFGSGAFGGSAFGTPGAGQAFGNNQFGPVVPGGFLGVNATQTQNFFRNLGGGQRRTTNIDFTIENLNEMRDRGGRGSSGDYTPPVRVKLRPAFEVPSATVQQMSADLRSRLTMNAEEMGVADAQFSIDGRTIVLEGNVATEHQRALVEKLVSLEPGVTQVDNRLRVDASLAQQDGVQD